MPKKTELPELPPIEDTIWAMTSEAGLTQMSEYAKKYCALCYEAALSAMKAELSKLDDCNAVHANILAGKLKLTREQALNIAGATDYDKLKEDLAAVKGEGEAIATLTKGAHGACSSVLNTAAVDRLPNGVHSLYLHLRAESPSDGKMLDWLQSKSTLHTEPEILYIVDGYEVSITRNYCTSVEGPFKGATLRDAIRSAMKGGRGREPQFSPAPIAIWPLMPYSQLYARFLLLEPARIIRFIVAP